MISLYNAKKLNDSAWEFQTPPKWTTEFPRHQQQNETSAAKLELKDSGSEDDERKNAISSKTERNEKTISVYENVGSEIGTVWYEYGCI